MRPSDNINALSMRPGLSLFCSAGGLPQTVEINRAYGLSSDRDNGPLVDRHYDLSPAYGYACGDAYGDVCCGHAYGNANGPPMAYGYAYG